MRHPPRGFVLMASLFVLAGMATFMAVGLTRSMTELVATNRFVAVQQAFHLAEAGVDAALQDPRLQNTVEDPLTQVDVNALIGHPLFTDVPMGDGDHTYTVRVEDDGAANDPLVVLVATGAASAVAEELRITAQLPVAAQGPRAFDYAVAALYLNMDGSAELGTFLDRISVLIDGYRLDGNAFNTSQGNTVFATKVEFTESASLDELCRTCPTPPNDNSVFPGPPQFNFINAVETAFTLDLNPYYSKAISQCMAEGTPQAGCESGTSYHHITATSPFTTIDASDFPGGLDGIIYVERGVNVKFVGDVVIRGTIVHEGGYVDPVTGARSGYLTVRGRGNSLTVDSSANNPVNGEEAFAKGLAIIGSPVLQFGSTIGINGFVMGGVTGVGGAGAAVSNIASSAGVIRGGALGVRQGVYLGGGVWDSLPPFNVLGPGTPDPILYSLSSLDIAGHAKIEFQPLPGTPPGFPTGGGNETPTVLLWSSQ